ncbi:MAG: hypothetical protein ACREF9_04795 [Opitutaceae bacterium]
MQVDGILDDEPFKQRGNEIDFGKVCGDVWIEIAWVRANPAVKNLIAVALFDRAFAFEAAGGEQEARDNGQETGDDGQGTVNGGQVTGNGGLLAVDRFRAAS